MIIGAQDVWRTGSRVYVREIDPDLPATGPLYDLGTIQVVSPENATEAAELFDADGGVQRLVAREMTKITEKYAVKLHNLNMRNLRYLFHAEGANTTAAQLYAQSSNGATSGRIMVWPGEMVKIEDTSGNGIFNLAAITAITNSNASAVTSYTADLVRGIVSFSSNATWGATSGCNATAGTITFQLNTVAQSFRRIYPQTKTGMFQGKIYIVWGRNNNEQQTIREFTGQITAGAGQFQVDQFSTFDLTIEVLADLTNTTAPAGILTQPYGNIPTGVGSGFSGAVGVTGA